jgi:hypothetical protein
MITSGNLFAFYPTGENALGITPATFSADASNTRAKSVTLEYYNTTGRVIHSSLLYRAKK